MVFEILPGMLRSNGTASDSGQSHFGGAPSSCPIGGQWAGSRCGGHLGQDIVGSSGSLPHCQLLLFIERPRRIHAGSAGIEEVFGTGLR